MFFKFATILQNKFLLTQLLPALAHLEAIASSLPAAACQLFPSCIEGEHCWSCFRVWWPLSLPPNGSKAEEGKKRKAEKCLLVDTPWFSYHFARQDNQSAALGCVFWNGGLKAVVGMLALLLSWNAGSLFSVSYMALDCPVSPQAHIHCLGLLMELPKFHYYGPRGNQALTGKSQKYGKSTQVLLWAELQWLQVSELIRGSFWYTDQRTHPYPPKCKISFNYLICPKKKIQCFIIILVGFL